MVLNPSPLQDHVAIIAGGSGGIGRAVARALGAVGARVVLAGKTPKRVRRAHEQLVAHGIDEEHVASLAVDLAQPEAGAAVVGLALERFGRLDVLVNAAGVGVFKRFNALTRSEIEEVVASNLLATIYLTHHAQEALIARQGYVVNIASGLGRRGARDATAYAAAKFGVRGFSESLRIEMARYGVRVSCISPAGAGVDTEFWERADNAAPRPSMLPAERIAELILVLLTTRGTALIDDVTIRTR